MPEPRRKKFDRSDVRDPLSLTERDAGIMRDVAEYRFLNSAQLLALHSGGERNLKQRLSLLYQHHFLDRPDVQKKADLASDHLVYSLDRKGAEILGKDAQGREALLRRIRESKRTSSIIAHALMISQFRVCLTLALKKRPDIKLTRWMQGDDLKTALRASGRSPELVPDAFFTLDDGGGAVNFFLEADRGTETAVSTFVRKKLKVYYWWKDDERLKAALGIKRFRVLTITPLQGRAESLCRAGKEASASGQGSPMFLFAPETLYSISKPDEILEAAWKSPADDLTHLIIE
jgi:hypothetical protein